MNKNLKILQVLAKIGRILSTIVFVCGIVGAAGCLFGIISLASGVEVIKIGDLTLGGIIENEAGMSMGTLYTAMACSAIVCGGEIAIAKFAELYFKKELVAGTPFTDDGAKELFRLGIITVCVSFGSYVLASICHGIMAALLTDVSKYGLADTTSFGLGIVFIVVSFILKCANEQLRQNQNNENTTV